MVYYEINPNTKKILKHDNNSEIAEKLFSYSSRTLDCGVIKVYYSKEGCEWTLEMPSYENQTRNLEFQGTCFVAGFVVESAIDGKLNVISPSISLSKLKKIVKW